MMHDRLVVPGLSDDEQDELDFLLAQLVARQPRNLLRASYYDGKRAIRQVGSVIPPQYFNLGIVLGWSAKAVDMLARRCNPTGFAWADGDLESLGLAEFRDRNQLMAQIKSGVVSSLIHGVSWMVNTTGDTKSGENRGLVHVKDALSGTGRWSDRAHVLRSFLSVQEWDDDHRPSDFALYLPNLTITASRDELRRWSVDRVQHVWGVPVDPLVYKPRVGRAFGASRISRPIMSLHDQAIRTVIRMEGHMDIYSYPEMWMLGADMSMFKNSDGSQKAAWQVMLGRIKGIPDDDEAQDPRNARADVKQFPASSPEPHLEAWKQQAMAFAGEASIPLTSLGIADSNEATSADSYIASREDLIAEAEGATDDWSVPVNRVVARGLAMQNGERVPDELASLSMYWRSPVHVSRAAAADAGQKQLAAVPWLAETEVGLELLGLTPQQIERAVADRRRSQGRAALEAVAARGADRLMADGYDDTPVD